MIFIKSNQKNFVLPFSQALRVLINAMDVNMEVGKVHIFKPGQYFSITATTKKMQQYGTVHEKHFMINLDRADESIETFIEPGNVTVGLLEYRQINVCIDKADTNFDWLYGLLDILRIEFMALQSKEAITPMLKPDSTQGWTNSNIDSNFNITKTESIFDKNTLKSENTERPGRLSSFTGEVDDKFIEDRVEEFLEEEQNMPEDYIKVDSYNELIYYGGAGFKDGKTQFIEGSIPYETLNSLDALTVQIYPQVVRDFLDVWEDTEGEVEGIYPSI